MSILLLALAGTSGSVHFDRWENNLPHQSKWGPYTVRIENIRGDKHDHGEPERLLIKDCRGRVIFRVRGYWFLRVEEINLLGKGTHELHIWNHTGGAYCCNSDTFLTLRGKLHHLITTYSEEHELKGIKDLDEDGVPELIVDNPVLGDFSGYNFHRHWPLITILKWNGKRYIDATGRFPHRAIAQANDMREPIVNAVKERTRDWDLKDKMACYYANMLAGGQGALGRKWLRAKVPHAGAWLAKYDGELRDIVRTAKRRRCRTTTSKSIDVNHFHNNGR